MNLTSFFFRITSSIESKAVNIYSVSTEEQNSYLNRLREPRDLTDRSYLQYKCQMYLKNRMSRILYNLLSLPLIIYYLLKQSDNSDVKENTQAVFLGLGLSTDLIPDELLLEYKEIINLETCKEGLDCFDRKYIFRLWKRYPLAFMFVLKCIIKIRMYSYIIRTYRPNAIITSEEYSFVSSCITDYCREKNIEHINIMHGEKVFFIRDAFVEFDRFYVWDEYYVNLFIDMRAAENQFLISVPKALKIDKIDVSLKKVDFTYYLANEDKESLRRIASNLKKLREGGNIIAVRCHPRYTDIHDVKQIFKDVALIEINEELSIRESLQRTKNAISLFSTVLNQAYSNDINPIIDDISSPEKFIELKNVRYRFADLDKEHLLSFYLE